MSLSETYQGLITLEQLQEALAERVGGMWELRKCSICYTPLHYMIVDVNTILFDSNCNCTRQFVEPQRRPIYDLQDTFNMQTETVRERMWADFLLTEPNPERALRWR